MAEATKNISGTAPITGALDLISYSWKIFTQKWKKLFWFLLLFPVVITIASLLLGAIVPGIIFVFDKANMMGIGLKILYGTLLIAAYAAIIISMIYFSVVINASVAYLVAREITAKEAFKEAQTIFWKFFWWSIIISIIIGVGFLLFVIPGIIVAVFLSFSLFFITLEGLGPIQSLKASARLVKGFWWTIFARLVVLGVIVLIVSMISNMFTTIGMSILTLSNKGALILALAAIFGVITFVIAFAINFIMSSVSLIYSYQLYAELKELKEKDSNATDNSSIAKKAGLIAVMILILFFALLGLLGVMLYSILSQTAIPNNSAQQQIQQQIQNINTN